MDSARFAPLLRGARRRSNLAPILLQSIEIASLTFLINAVPYGYNLPSYHQSFHLPVGEGRTEESGVFVGEAIGLMRDVLSVDEILMRVTREAESLLRERGPALVA